MSKKNKELENIAIDELLQNSKVQKIEIESEMKKSFISYAMAVNVSRAIPDVRDGLKPVHRRILYSMSELGLAHDKPYRKCARIVGDVLGKYHPHGDSAVYGALVRLAQDFNIRYPLVQGHGNFGSVDGDSPAAQRYTEARLAAISEQMLRDIDSETVDYYPNFDDTLMQPTVLPARIPALLVNGADGIAVGMATSIPPHNLGEVIDGVVALADNPEIDIEDLMKIIPAPDYPTYGQIMGRSNLKTAYRTGRGGVVIRAKCEIEEYGATKSGTNTRSRIIVTELPYQVNKEELIKTIADLVKDKKIEGVANANDESDRHGMRIVIDIKRDAQPSVVLNQLYKHTNLQVSNGITFLALVEGTPRVLNLKEMLYYYLEHQKDVVTRRTKYDLAKAKERAHILEGLVKALANIDEVVKIIKESKEATVAQERLCETFILTEIQANAILEMKLRRLTALEVEKLQAELADLAAKIEDYEDILAHPQRIVEIVRTEILEIKAKYSDERRTRVVIDMGEINYEDMIPREDVVVSITHAGYIKRLGTDEYRTQGRGGKGVTAHKPKDEDFVENLFIAGTHDDLLCFTSLGRVHAIKTYEIPEAARAARGRAIINLIQLQENELVTAIIPLKEKSAGETRVGYLMMATRMGIIKKTPVSEFEKMNKLGKIAIRLAEGDELIGVMLTSGGEEILLASHKGQAIRFDEKKVRSMGRTTFGVRSMRLEDGDYIVDMTRLYDGCQLITITENGFGKRTSADDYRLTNRGGKGVKSGKLNEDSGNIVGIKQIGQKDDIMVITNDGTVIRVHAQEIRHCGRNTRGVRVMRMKEEDSRVVSIAINPDEEDVKVVDELVGVADGENEDVTLLTDDEVLVDVDNENIQEENIENDVESIENDIESDSELKNVDVEESSEDIGEDGDGGN